MDRQAGFTLLEVLIAFAILSLALVGVVNSFSQSARLQFVTNHAAGETKDIIAIQSELNRLSQRAIQTGPVRLEMEGRAYIIRAQRFQNDLYIIDVSSSDAPLTPLLQTWTVQHDSEQ